MKGMNFRSGKGSILPQFMGGGSDLIGSRRRHKSAAQLTAHFFGMVFLIVIHGGLIIWASTLAISFLYRVDLSSESVKVNEALEVFGEQNTDWLDTAGGITRQAHVRIGSRGDAEGTTRADEVLEFGTYRGDQFVPKSLLRSEGDGTLEVVTNGNRLALAPTGGDVGIGTNVPTALLDVAGEAVVRGNASFGGNDLPSLVKIDSQGSQTVGLQLGPDPGLESGIDGDGRRRLLDANTTGDASTSSVFNKKSFGVYSLVGGEQVVVKRGNDTVLRFDDNENTEVSAVNDVKIESRDGDVSLVSASGKIRIMGAVEFGGSDLTGTIANSVGSTGSVDLSALSVVNGTVKLEAPKIVHNGRTEFNGTFTVGNGETIQLGWSYKDTIDMRGTIVGQTPLTFGGTGANEGKIAFVVDEPTSSWRTIKIPDASGRLVVSAISPLSISSFGEMELNQSLITTVGALEKGSITSTFGDINIERSALKASELTVRKTTRLEGPVWGEIPIHFARNATLGADGFVTNFYLKYPTAKNTINIPDSNGTFTVTVSNPHGFQLDARGHLEFNYTTFNTTGWLNDGRIIPGFGDINVADESISANSFRIQNFDPVRVSSEWGDIYGEGGDKFVGGTYSYTMGTIDSMFNTSDPVGYGVRIKSADGVHNANTPKEEAQGRYIHILAGAANSSNVSGGAVYIFGGETTGSGDESAGGDVIISGGAGKSLNAAGGSIKLTSGTGANQTSGDIALETGSSEEASSGKVTIKTGASTDGSGGDITMTVGTGNTGSGGAMTLTAGESTAASGTGGAVTVTAGQATAGAGGAVSISGGDGASALGGAVTVTSGVGTATSSGGVTVATADGGSAGMSGNMVLKTGNADNGNTGSYTVTTGAATNGVAGGINMTVGTGDGGTGGAMTLTAGDTSAANAAGGSLDITAGSSTTSGGVGGGVTIDAGAAVSGVENGNVTIGASDASAVTIGRTADDARILMNGLAEAYTFKVGRQDYSGVQNKHLMFDSENFTIPDLYPGSVYILDVYTPGSALGDIVQASFSKSLGNAYLTAQVNVDDYVRVAVHNPGYNTVVEQFQQGTFVITCTAYAASPYAARFAVSASP